MNDPNKAQRRLLHNARREMWLVLVIIALALVWTVGYCYLNGYQHESDSWLVQSGWAQSRSSEDFQQIGGLPDWVVVGIILPWMACTALGVGLGLGLKDDALDEETPAEAGTETREPDSSVTTEELSRDEIGDAPAAGEGRHGH